MFDKVLCDKKRIINFLSKFRRRRILFDVAIDYFDVKVKIKKGEKETAQPDAPFTAYRIAN